MPGPNPMRETLSDLLSVYGNMYKQNLYLLKLISNCLHTGGNGNWPGILPGLPGHMAVLRSSRPPGRLLSVGNGYFTHIFIQTLIGGKPEFISSYLL